MEKIIVLLSTYNGERYLPQQLESLHAQAGVDVEILVRDDGSRDGTTAILDEWAEDGRLSWYTSGNLGPGKSFIHLLKTAVPGHYYAFCDQDDIWLPRKLSLTMEKMRAVEKENPGKPVIVHTDMNVVDENLDIIHDSFWRSSGLRPDILRTFPYLCTCNSVNGCTIVMNSIARELILEKYVEHGRRISCSSGGYPAPSRSVRPFLVAGSRLARSCVAGLFLRSSVQCYSR